VQTRAGCPHTCGCAGSHRDRNAHTAPAECLWVPDPALPLSSSWLANPRNHFIFFNTTRSRSHSLSHSRSRSRSLIHSRAIQGAAGSCTNGGDRRGRPPAAGENQLRPAPPGLCPQLVPDGADARSASRPAEGSADPPEVRALPAARTRSCNVISPAPATRRLAWSAGEGDTRVGLGADRAYPPACAVHCPSLLTGFCRCSMRASRSVRSSFTP
jgi:hypothetical protein